MSNFRKTAGRLVHQVLNDEQRRALKRLLNLPGGEPSPAGKTGTARLVGDIAQLMANSRAVLDAIPAPAAAAPRVLIYAANGRALTNFFEGLLAHALRLRGAVPAVLYCDQFFNDYCDVRYVSQEDPDAICERCFYRANALFDAYELPVLHFGSLAARDVNYDALLAGWLAQEADSPLINTVYRDIRIGHLAYSSTLHYLLIGTFDLGDPQIRGVFLRLLVHTARLVDALEAALAQVQPDVVVQTHSLYILWGTMAEVCRKHGITFYDYFFGYRANTMVFGKNDAYQWTLIKEPADHWQGVPLSAAQDANIVDYMTRRELGDRDDLAYFRDLPQTTAQVRDLLKLDDRPIIGAFPNLGWDGAVLFREAAFNHLFDWAVGLVRWAEAHPQIQLVVRSHPAEVQKTSRSREFVQDAIFRAFPALPENVRVIGPEDPLNSYALMPLLDVATVYSSKVGFETAYRGIPTVVAGMAFYRNRGFTFDASTADEYFTLLGDIPRLKDIHARQGYSALAKRFSYYFFFQKYMDVSFVRWKYQQDIILNIASLGQLAPGANRSMDVICDILLHDRPTYLTLDESEQLQAENRTFVQ